MHENTSLIILRNLKKRGNKVTCKIKAFPHWRSNKKTLKSENTHEQGNKITLAIENMPTIICMADIYRIHSQQWEKHPC